MCWDEIMFYCPDSARHILINSVLAVGCALIFCVCCIVSGIIQTLHPPPPPPVVSTHWLKVDTFIFTGMVFFLLLLHYIHSYWF